MSDRQAEAVIAEIASNPYADPTLYETVMAFGAQIGMPDEGVEVGLMLADAERSKGNLDEAMQMYGMMLASAPKNIEAMIGLTHCLLEADLPEQAYLLASAVIVSDYFRPDGHILSAKANTMNGHFDDAETDLQVVLDMAKKAGDGKLELIAGKLLRENRKAEEEALAFEVDASDDELVAEG